MAPPAAGSDSALPPRQVMPAAAVASRRMAGLGSTARIEARGPRAPASARAPIPVPAPASTAASGPSGSQSATAATSRGG